MKDIYLALDFPTWGESEQFLTDSNLIGVPVKVGMELFYQEGIHAIERLKENGHPIFLDLKLHDIPTTVFRAMRNLAQLEVDYVNVHALGGADMIYRAKEALTDAPMTKLLAVTILTSHEEAALRNELRLPKSVTENVVHLATLAKKNGADGVVCSVHEVEQIRKHTNDSFVTMTPGIRLASSSKDDQRRVATPAFAKRAGASALVIGRSITAAENPFEGYKQACEEWEHGTE